MRSRRKEKDVRKNIFNLSYPVLFENDIIRGIKMISLFFFELAEGLLYRNGT